MSLKLIIVLTAGIIFCLGACNNNSAGYSNSWYKDIPENNPLLSWEGKKIPESNIHIVSMLKESEAEKLLQNVSILEINNEQASGFTGKQLPIVPNTKPYLVRGVLYEGNETGRFSALVNGNQMRVHFGCLGDYHTSIKQQSLVIQLESMPSIIFVTCSMAK